MSILVVDDSAGQRLLITAHLRAAGYTALRVADSAAAAFAHLEMDAQPPTGGGVEVILLDIEMPELDGIGACTQIRAAGLTDIPIIMVTASTEAPDLEAAFAAGATDYLTKPVTRPELLARLRVALALKRAFDQRRAYAADLATAQENLDRLAAQLARYAEQTG